MNSATFKSPIGDIALIEDGGAITELHWHGTAQGEQTPVLTEGLRQLEAYFEGDLHRFTLPLAPRASPFQHGFYEALLAIPYGETKTYGEIAKALGVSAQAIGQACGANPIGLIIPCHRVLGANSLGGFSSPDGVEAKVWLLKHEGAAGLLI